MLSPLITATNLGVTLGGKTLLQDVNLSLHANEIVTLVGPNGAGKSTLLRAMLGLLAPTSGRVERQADLVIGYTPQRIHLDPVLPLRVHRFLRLSGSFSDAQIEQALSRVGVEAVIASFVCDLSGGELQRVLLARALLRSPDILVLDEPTQGVDLMGQTDLYRCIADIKREQGCGVLLVSHDLNIVMAETDRVICLHHHICCEGQPEAVSQDPAFARLFGPEAGRQFALYAHHHNHAHDVGGDIKGEGSDV